MPSHAQTIAVPCTGTGSQPTSENLRRTQVLLLASLLNYCSVRMLAESLTHKRPPVSTSRMDTTGPSHSNFSNCVSDYQVGDDLDRLDETDGSHSGTHGNATEAPRSSSPGSSQSTRSILDMSAKIARAFFLKQESYSNFELPPYFRFDDLLHDISTELGGKSLKALQSSNPCDLEDVSHTILSNKDGRFAWRPIQLCHPVLYVALVHDITEASNWQKILDRYEEFRCVPRTTCMSLPVQSRSKRKDKAEQVLQWWQEIEQRSIELALDYNVLIHADISDCYGALYTHSIAWALHTKPIAKEKRKGKGLVGNTIDRRIQEMRHGQTNGIPQGSVLMDFIAEMVLGYADTLIGERIHAISISDYQVLRYRDDYRIFAKSVADAECVLKCIADTLAGLGLRLNSQKTEVATDVITSAIKAEKLAWLNSVQEHDNLEKQLLLVRQHGIRFPNAGSLQVALGAYLKRIISLNNAPKQIRALISIVVDIAFHNPKAQPLAMAVLSKLLSLLNTAEEKQGVVDQIMRKFAAVPNTGYLEIWLQRATLHSGAVPEFTEPLCMLAAGNSVQIWNNSWISNKRLNQVLDERTIVDRDAMEKLPEVVAPAEVQLFGPY